METGYNFYHSGFNITFDEQTEVNKRNKKPDIKLFNTRTKEELYVEISIQEVSDSEKEANKTWFGITDLLLNYIHDIEYRGKIHKSLSDTHLNKIKQI